MRIGVCSTLAAYVMEPEETWSFWISNFEELQRQAATIDVSVHYFAALETDGRGITPLQPVVDRLSDIPDSDYWTYTLDDRRTSVTTENRLRHLTMGQNLASEWCSATGMNWMLFLAADTRAPDDIVPRMLEMRHPLCGPELPTYCLSGPVVPGYPFPVQEHMISAACIFIERTVFKRLRWRADGDLGMSDDPAYQYDAETLLGTKSYVRKDCVARHFPECIPAIEVRFPERDLSVYR